MATIRTNPAVTSITFTTTGVVAGTAGVFAGITPVEATACVQGFQLNGQPRVKGGNILSMPLVISSITINGQAYAVSGAGDTSALGVADLTALLVGACGQPFQLVTG